METMSLKAFSSSRSRTLRVPRRGEASTVRSAEPSERFRPLVPALLRVEVELRPRLPGLRGEALGELDRARVNRRAAARSASSGSTFTNRATFTTREEDVAELRRDSRVSGSRLGARADRHARSLRAARRAPLAASRRGRRGRASRSRRPPHVAATFRARSSAGSDAGTSWKIPLRPSCSVLIVSQRARTWPGVAASASPNTCGCLRTSFSWTSARDRVEVAFALLLEQQREEEHLEEQVAELVAAASRRIAGERRLRDLVRLLDRVRDDRPGGLLAVPRALDAAGAR